MSSPLTFAEVLARFGPGKQSGRNYRVRCPAHDDTTPSLDIAEGDQGAPIFQCRSNHCQSGDIIAAVGLTWADVLPPSDNGHTGMVWDHVYEYKDRAGVVRYSVYRQDATGSKGKQIRQRAANGDWSLKGIDPLPYRLPELHGPSVLVAEGEKTVDALSAAGFDATCNSGGAGKWRDSDTKALKDAGIKVFVILPDNDAPGLLHAAVVEASAAKYGLTTRRAILPGLEPGGDAADWLLTHTPEELEIAIKPQPPPTLPDLIDAVDVVAEGRQIAASGIPYVIEGIMPDYGMLGFLVAAAKVGKTSLGHALAAAVANGEEFLGRAVAQRRVLVIAAEDPPEYTAYLARHLEVTPGQMTFYRSPLRLNAEGLALIVNTVKAGGYGLVLIASWQAVIVGLVKDENDNAGSVMVVENVKQATRSTAIPWLIDAHAGKGEDQGNDADPTKSLRGASSAAGAADYLLSLRYANSPFSTQRRLSGKGRFVNLESITIDYDMDTGRYSAGEASKTAIVASTWELIEATGALDGEWATTQVIAVRAGMGDSIKDITGNKRRLVSLALKDRHGVDRSTMVENDRSVTRYRRSESKG